MSVLTPVSFPGATPAPATTTPAPRQCATSHTRKLGLQPCGCDTLWAVVEPRLLAANRAFVADAMTYDTWRDELHAVRVALGLEVM